MSKAKNKRIAVPDLMSHQELLEKTLDERGENYADRTNLFAGTYRGDVVTAYVIGASEERRLNKMDVDRFINMLQSELAERRDGSASWAFERAIELAKFELL